MAAAQFHHERAEGASSIRDRVERMIEVTEKMLNSVDEHLQDPDNPGRYILHPDAESVRVALVETREDGSEIRRSKNLQELIEEIREAKPKSDVVSLSTRQIDLKELLLKAVDSMEKAVKLLGQIDGSIKDPNKIDLTLFPVWQEIQAVLISVTKEYPEARERIVDGLKKLSAADSGDS